MNQANLPKQKQDAADVAHTSISYIPLKNRVFGFAEHSTLWFSFGVGLLVMQMGAYLLPALSLSEAILVIIIGSLLGSYLLAWVASLGCRYGLSSSALVSAALGSKFSRLPVALNVVQLLGWAAFELVVMRDSTSSLILHILGINSRYIYYAATLFWGGALLVLSTCKMTGIVRRFLRYFALPLVIIALCWLWFKFLSQAHNIGSSELFIKKGDGSLSMFSALDLVIAMPISWLPLAADYGRYGKKESSTLKGTFFGYLIANITCYTLGVLIIAITPKNLEFISAIIGIQGGLLAISFILLDEADNAYGDIHSASVSANFLFNAFSIRNLGMFIVILATFCALFLPMQRLENFLMLLSSVFVPLFGLVIARLMFSLPQKVNVHFSSVLIWIFGICIFQFCSHYLSMYGSTIPSLVFTFCSCMLIRFIAK